MILSVVFTIHRTYSTIHPKTQVLQKLQTELSVSGTDYVSHPERLIIPMLVIDVDSDCCLLSGLSSAVCKSSKLAVLSMVLTVGSLHLSQFRSTRFHRIPR